MKQVEEYFMEYLDIYDEQGNHLGIEDRSIVHRDALWHKTVHCWLYDRKGNIFFQIRQEEQKLYTTASGHLQAGETISSGFAREIQEEIGITIDASDAELVSVVPFVMDRQNKDGSWFRDRAFANVYVDLYEGDYQDFCFDPKEVSGLVLVPAIDTLKVLEQESGSILGKVLCYHDDKIEMKEKQIFFEDFLVNPHETAIGKYGDILKKVISLTTK